MCCSSAKAPSIGSVTSRPATSRRLGPRRRPLISAIRGTPMAEHSLDEIARDPAKGASLSAITRAGLLAQCAVVMATLAASMVASKDVHKPAQDVSLDVMTTKQLAEMWEMPEAKIRDLCRTGRLPAKKLGTKEWVIGRDALRDWLPKAPLSPTDSPTLSSHRDPGRGPQAAPAARPFTVEVRRPPRRPQGDGGEVGSRDAGHERDDGPPVARAA